MNSVRSTKATYIAAFLLGALIAVIFAAPARSAESSALNRIGVVRFTEEGDGQLRRQSAVLHDDGRLDLRGASLMPRPANTPVWALGRTLVPLNAWLAYHALGYEALARFELQDFGARIFFADEPFLLVGPSFSQSLADGQVINASAHTRIVPGIGTDYAVVGFVIEGRPRKVLVRAAGPTLRRFGIGNWLADPRLSIMQSSGRTLYTNDDWSDAAEAAAIRATETQVGAFALETGAKDAARLVELPPGAYTVVVQSAITDTRGGDVLVEIYSVPVDAVDVSAQPGS
jgi:hypothetical protein